MSALDLPSGRIQRVAGVQLMGYVLDKKGMVVFEKVSHSHGDRLSAEDALNNLSAR
jgi:hypothetical protein